MITDPEKDWPEDFTHENGNYINTCIECKEQFRGHKRRIICRECMTPDWIEMAKKMPPKDNKCAHAGCWADGEMTGYARCTINKVIPLELELASLKKLYNDLAESHAKQVIEIGEQNESYSTLMSDYLIMKNDYKITKFDLQSCAINKNDLESTIEEYKKGAVGYEMALDKLESELLKAKELITKCAIFMHDPIIDEAIIEFLNKK